jgi:tetratricopeptide (TPR) repeat protein
VEELNQELSRVYALHRAGRSAEAFDVARRVAAQAGELGYVPLQATANLWLAETLMATGGHGEAVEAARRAFDLALAGSDDRSALHATTLLAFSGAHDTSRKDESLRWVRTGQSLLERLKDEPELAAKLANAEGNIYLTAGDAEKAIPAFEYSVEAFTRMHPDHPNIGSNVAMLGIAHMQRGQFDEAESRLRDALSRAQRTLGAEHPEVASTLINLSLVMSSKGDYGEAEALLRRALDLQQRIHGDSHPFMVYSRMNLAIVLHQRGKFTDAESEFKEAERIAELHYGRKHPLTAQALANHADLLARLGRGVEALEKATRAHDIVRSALGAENPAMVMAHGVLALAHRVKGDGASSLAHARKAITLSEKAFGPKHPQTLIIRQQLGETLLSAGQLEAAHRTLRQAEEVLMTEVADPRRLADVRFAMARALEKTDRTTAVELARKALSGFPADGNPRAREEIRAWIQRVSGEEAAPL